jgi:superfamily I DNA/RNA helicase
LFYHFYHLTLGTIDKKRIPKSLYSFHPAGPAPLLKSFSTPSKEAAFLASEIKRIEACMGGMLSLNDFVIISQFSCFFVRHKLLKLPSTPQRDVSND